MTVLANVLSAIWRRILTRRTPDPGAAQYDDLGTVEDAAHRIRMQAVSFTEADDREIHRWYDTYRATGGTA